MFLHDSGQIVGYSEVIHLAVSSPMERSATRIPALTDALAGSVPDCAWKSRDLRKRSISAPADYAEILTPLSGLSERYWV
jgi:hypothetical protein